MQKGFTLLEMLVALLIVAILLGLAWMMYHKHIVKTHRTLMQSHMMTIAHTLQRHKTIHKTWQQVSLESLGYASYYPQDKAKYQVVLDIQEHGWILKAQPLAESSQSQDGIICLNHQLQQYRQEKASECDLNEQSTW